MKKETWFQVDIWEETKEGLKRTRFTKHIKNELLILNDNILLFPVADWDMKYSQSLCFPSKNKIVSIIHLYPSLSKSDIENINKAKKLLKENGYVEEDCD